MLFFYPYLGRLHRNLKKVLPCEGDGVVTVQISTLLILKVLVKEINGFYMEEAPVYSFLGRI